jgi:drug/metabolite transporter (DMT)-like permease
MARILYVQLGFLSLIWGGSFFFIKILLEHFGPWSIAWMRTGLGAVVIALVMFISREKWWRGSFPWVPLILVGLLNTTIPWSLIGFSETRITSSMASVLNATTPLWTMVVGIAVFGSKSGKNQWIGLGVAFLGLMLLVGFNPASIMTVDPLGFLAMLGATFCYAIASHISKKYLHDQSVYTISLFSLIFGWAGCLVPVWGWETFSFHPLLDWKVACAIVALGALGAGAAYLLLYNLIQKGSAEFASLVTYLIPVTAIFWGSLFLHEPLTWNLLAGMIGILAGVYLATRPVKFQSSAVANPSR